jgi:4-hydroxy 2-oxovalerate aldolase
MNNVKILDCTLRDGGRIIDCAFPDSATRRITDGLVKAKIDIIELGFLRDGRDVNYEGNSTFFTEVEQISKFTGNRGSSEFVAFIDFGMFDFNTLKPFDGSSIDGLRIGFTKKDYVNSYDSLVSSFKKAKECGYKLYVQGVNSLNYSDKELLEILETVNDIKPDSFGIVDTYGAMYIDDVTRLYNLIDHNLDKDIAIDFHSHNNFQLSFSFAQEVIKLSRGVRKIIIDSTLNGMGKQAGNLNTELLVDYLIRKMDYDYNFESILDNIDTNILKMSEFERWGYSTSAFMSGIYKSHPNNVIYLLEKHRLDTNGIKNILSMMNDKERQQYDYSKLDSLFKEYLEMKYDDTKEIDELKKIFESKPVLVLAPGNTIKTHSMQINEHIAAKSPVIISLNFISEYKDAFVFWANKKRFETLQIMDVSKNILTSDIKSKSNGETIVSYHGLFDSGVVYESSLPLLLNLLKKLGVKSVAIAGMDGYVSQSQDDYFDKTLMLSSKKRDSKASNKELSDFLKKYIKNFNVELITPSIFKDIIP